MKLQEGGQIGEVKCQQQPAAPAFDETAVRGEGQSEGHDAAPQCNRHFLSYDLDGMNDGRDGNNPQPIADIAAEQGAEADFAVAAKFGNDGGREFRYRCTDGDNGRTDGELVDAKSRRFTPLVV